MRPRFRWDAYDQVNYQLSFLCNPPYKEIIQLVGCHNKVGVTKQFILDNCRIKMLEENLEMAIDDLKEQGYLRAEPPYPPGHFGPKETYYKVNWSVIKAINNAIKRMP